MEACRALLRQRLCESFEAAYLVSATVHLRRDCCLEPHIHLAADGCVLLDEQTANDVIVHRIKFQHGPDAQLGFCRVRAASSDCPRHEFAKLSAVVQFAYE